MRQTRHRSHSVRIRSTIALAFVVGGLSVGASTVDAGANTSGRLVDRFSAKRLDSTRWRHWWGDARAGGNAVVLASRPPVRLDETFSALITSRQAWRDFALTATMRPLRQLRLNDPGNTWETGWIVFRFRDLENYYYFILKPNGWELGKKHGSDAQIFLATGSSPRLSIGRKARLRIAAVGSRIRVRVNGVRILDFTDPKPLRSGSVGLYEEDARVRFGPVTVTAR
jgi:hypothetical protein